MTHSATIMSSILKMKTQLKNQRKIGVNWKLTSAKHVEITKWHIDSIYKPIRSLKFELLNYFEFKPETQDKPNDITWNLNPTSGIYLHNIFFFWKVQTERRALGAALHKVKSKTNKNHNVSDNLHYWLICYLSSI